eukprot:m51a1_g7847 hypothetical protein (100) ;mRNA; r:220313-220612
MSVDHRRLSTQARLALTRLALLQRARGDVFSAAREAIGAELARGADERARARARATAADLDQARLLDALEPHLRLLAGLDRRRAAPASPVVPLWGLRVS